MDHGNCVHDRVSYLTTGKASCGILIEISKEASESTMEFYRAAELVEMWQENQVTNALDTSLRMQPIELNPTARKYMIFIYWIRFSKTLFPTTNRILGAGCGEGRKCSLFFLNSAFRVFGIAQRGVWRIQYVRFSGLKSLNQS